MADFSRRLPVYLLLDCSGSMMGEPIEAVKQGVKALLSELRGDPQALETAYLSVITFDSSARQITPLTELMQFKEPEISAGGATALGGALNVLIDCVNNEVRKSTETQKGDWRPLVSPCNVLNFCSPVCLCHLRRKRFECRSAQPFCMAHLHCDGSPCRPHRYGAQSNHGEVR